MTFQLFPENPVLARRLAIGGSLLAIIGAKLWLIQTHGSAVPFWDQWDGEAARVFRPYFAGTLRFADFVATHNEHRVLFTRLAALGLLITTGRWDAIVQMLLNVFIHTAAIGFLLIVLCRALDQAGTMLLAFFTLLFFAVPFAWENTLGGFQGQFYLLILLAILSMYLLCDAAAWTARWWLGTLTGISSYFCMAAGALTLPAFIVLALAQFAMGQRRGRAEILGLVFHATITAMLVYDIPVVASHDALKVHSVGEWIRALFGLASWPVVTAAWPRYLSIVSAAILYAPVIALGILTVRERPPRADWRWLYLGIAAWIGLQLVAFAYGRGIGAFYAERYRDVFIIGLMINAACLFRLALIDFRERARVPITLAAALWLIAVFVGAGQKALNNLPRDLAWRRDSAVFQAENLKRFFATGNPAELENKPPFHIPFHSAPALIELVSDPNIRAIMPPVLLGQPDTNAVKHLLLKIGPLLLPIGLALLMTGATVACRIPASRSSN